MNNQKDRDKITGMTSLPGVNTTTGPANSAPTFIMMVLDPDPKHDDGEDNQPGNLPAEVPVTEPLTPVPAQDEVNPPLESTLGGGGVLIPLRQ
ncbi:MAG: hypothetical protein ABI644_05250 [Arenimonas sp.]